MTRAMTARIIRTALFALAVPLGGGLSAQQAQQPSLIATRLPAGVDIDLNGRLEEDVWQTAPAISDFTQQEPVEGAQPSRRTEIRVVYDSDHLFIGAKVFDDPDQILAFQRRRDAGLGTDDRFMWILDTFLDGRTGYFFEINAAGLMGDGLITSGQGHGVNKSWDGIWEARTDRQNDGWSVEIRIPFQTLNFDPESDTWGINFQRTIRRTNEEILWRGWRRSEGLFRPIHAGRLVGLEGMSQGIGLETRVSAVGGWRTVVADADPTTFTRDASVDVNYNLTSSLRASVSINTDFAEVEVDQRRVNLTRFPLRFEERRDFFLEGSGVFAFAPRSGPSPYFSRRIGLEQGEQIPINYGARLGGQVGPFEVGFIQVGTSEADHHASDGTVRLPGEQFTVARARRQLFSQSTIGAIYTRRSTSALDEGMAPEDRHTAGIDLNLATSTLFGGANADMEAFVVWNSNPNPATERSFSDLSARGFRFNFPNDVWEGHLSYREFGPAYSPAIGFVTRNDFRRVEPRFAWNPRPAGIPWLRRIDNSIQYRYLEGLGPDGVKEEEEWDFQPIGLRFESGDNIQFNVTRTYEFLDQGFQVSDGFEIQPGDYTVWEVGMEARTAGRRRVSGNVELSKGGFWDGDRTNYQLGLNVRPGPGLSVSANYDGNHVTLPDGDFSASVYRLSGGWEASPWISFSSNIQYDDVSDIVGLFFRGRWILTPGNDIFIVYTQNWQDFGPDGDALDRRFATISRGGAVKLNYTYRF